MDFTWLFIQMLIVLVVVCVGAVVVLRYVLPKMSWAKKWQKSGHFELIDRFGLDNKRTLYLVRVGKKYLVVGGGEQSLNLLAELPHAEVEIQQK
ncbi:MAG: flagellar biosynthetic protein FliO [Deltaproteobacteria bacterium]|nr:flagellar biosynthetic protein FliO [Deltaproteobacteria bacterium]